MFVGGVNAYQQGGALKLKMLKSTRPPAKVFKIEREQSLEDLH